MSQPVTQQQNHIAARFYLLSSNHVYFQLESILGETTVHLESLCERKKWEKSWAGKDQLLDPSHELWGQAPLQVLGKAEPFPFVASCLKTGSYESMPYFVTWRKRCSGKRTHYTSLAAYNLLFNHWWQKGAVWLSTQQLGTCRRAGGRMDLPFAPHLLQVHRAVGC